MTPSWSWLLSKWDFEPSIVVGIAILGLLYFVAWQKTRAKDGNWAAAWTYFILSMVTLVVALLSPLDYLGDNFLFSAHMIQHLLLATVWPPLLLLAIREPMAMRFLPRWFTKPISPVGIALVAFVIFNLDIAIWHLPSWYDLTLRNEGVHIVEHVTFMGAGLLAWWPVLAPIRSHRLGFAGQSLYLFASLFPTMGLGILFTFLPTALYSPYVAAPRIWGISAVADQQVGGLIMWMPGNIPYAIAVIAVLIRWFDRGDPSEGYGLVRQAMS